MFVVTLIVITIVLVVVQDCLKRHSRRWKLLCQFPGDYPLPLIGNALELGFDSDGAAQKILKIWERNGKTTFRMTVGAEDWVFLCEPRDVAVLFSDMSILSKSPERNSAISPFFGNSISTSEGDKWRWTRRVMSPSFHVNTLEQRLCTVNQRCDRLIEILDGLDEGIVFMYRYLRPYMFDILCRSFMGIDANYLDNLDDAYIRDSGKIVYMITENYFSYWRNIRPLFELTSAYRDMTSVIKTVKETSRDIISKRRAKLKKMSDEIKMNNKNTDIDVEQLIRSKLAEEPSLLDTLLFKTLPNGDPVPEDTIIEEISLVIFTGHYTTSVTISHTLYCLAKHMDIQRKVLEEQKAIFKDDFLRKPTVQDLNEMKYLDAVVKETMRVVPTVPKIGRNLEKDLDMKDGRVIPAGSTVIVYYEALFKNEKVFPEPEKFKPERFFENIHGSAFLPFAGGPRSCLGFRFATVAVKATLSNLLRRFEVTNTELEPQFSYRIINEAKNDVQLKLKSRILS